MVLPLKEPGQNPAAIYMENLIAYLKREEKFEVFSEITPVDVIQSPIGTYALFYALLFGKEIRIQWFLDMEIPALRLEAGWGQYGSRRVWREEWAEPLFEGQDTM